MATIKILQNSFKAHILSLSDDFITTSEGVPIKTVSGREAIVNAVFTDSESYITLVEESQKKHVLSLLYRVSDLIDILLKQEKSIRSITENERFDKDLNRKLSMEQSF